jgi:deoxyadenosine/deoxycytidine kinase
VLKNSADLIISRSIVKDKFFYKNINIDFINLEGRKEFFEASWDNSLIHQLKKLPDFNLVFSEVINF